MTAPVFVDTNVLVYSRDAWDKAKHQRARKWVESPETRSAGG
jgi:predicted nucleic acid-binding protein